LRASSEASASDQAAIAVVVVPPLFDNRDLRRTGDRFSAGQDGNSV
jgi:hypothetical protein